MIKKKLTSNRTIYKENKNFTITILSFNVTTNFFYFVIKLRVFRRFSKGFAKVFQRFFEGFPKVFRRFSLSFWLLFYEFKQKKHFSLSFLSIFSARKDKEKIERKDKEKIQKLSIPSKNWNKSIFFVRHLKQKYYLKQKMQSIFCQVFVSNMIFVKFLLENYKNLCFFGAPAP